MFAAPNASILSHIMRQPMFSRPDRQCVPRRHLVAVVVFLSTAAVFTAARLAADDEPAVVTGTFKGVVTFKGQPPERKLVVKKDDPKVREEDRAICAAEDYFSEDLIVNEKAGNGVANVVVYLKETPKGYKAPPVPEEPVILEVTGCRYTPHVLVLRCNQGLLVKNSDRLPHNAHLKPIQNSGVGQMIAHIAGRESTYQFKKPERVPMPVICDLHYWMKAHILLLDHPLAAVTDTEGKFELKGLPPGKHTFIVWHEMSGYSKKELPVTIKAYDVTEMDLSYGLADFIKP
jgi:hypothetical protein